jgi:Fic family protein
MGGEALKRIRTAFEMEYAFESNRIEGNTLTLQETALVVSEGVTIGGKTIKGTP